MSELSTSWSWISLALLGSFHGLNPAMGWLFAVALGLQERRTRAVATALVPVAAGHALAIGIVAAGVWLLGTVLPRELLLMAGGLSMVGFALHKVVSRFRHPRWVGMRVGFRDLVLWSFLMAMAHGAGLMLVPPLLKLRGDAMPTTMAHSDGHMHHMTEASGNGAGTWLLAIGLHTAAMLVVAGVIALVVYRKVGVGVLRRAWVNVDYLWVGALGITGILTMTVGLWSQLAS